MVNQRKKEATFIEKARRKQILEAALERFGNHGFHQTSLAEIADDLDISKGVISYHFGSKADLGRAVIRHLIGELSRSVEGRVARRRRGRDKLQTFVDACIDYTDQNRNGYLTYVDIIGSFGTMDEKREMIAWVNRRTREVIIDLIRQGQADGSVGRLDRKNTADVLQSIVDGLMEAAAAEPDVVNLKACKRLVRNLVDQLVPAADAG